MRNLPLTSPLAIAAALGLAIQVPAMAQDEAAQAPAPADPGQGEEPQTAENEILVIAQTLRGQVDAPQPPILELNEEDIAAYGAGSIADLIQALGPQVGSGRGRGGGSPVILVNGTRISSFRELRSYPPEAIEKIEVFPEEVAQRYGYSADQRVINLILKRNYSSRELEVEYGQPWDGGYSTKEVEATYLQIAGASRINFNLGWEDTSLLTEAERGVIQSTGGAPLLPTDPDPALYRSLVGDSAGLEATANVTTRLDDRGTSLSLNGTFERNDSLRLQGLGTVLLTDPGGASVLRTFGEDDPLTVDSRTTTYSLGATLNARLGDWQVTGTADGSQVDSRSRIDRRLDPLLLEPLQSAALAGTLPLDADLGTFPDAGFDRAETRSRSASTKLTAMGRPLLLPGGELALTVDAGYDWTSINSEDTRNPGVETSLKRGNLNAGVNIGVPITSRREDFGAAIGDLSLNLAGGVDHLSDFGTLTDWSVGLNWSPTERLSFAVTHIGRDAAPSLGQLGNPEIATFNVPVFDLSRGETALATVVTGGNPLLPAQSQRDWRIGLNWQLPEIPGIQQGRFTIDYYRNHSEDVASGFPLLTPTIEAAFPGRVTRDGTGRLVSVDQRPVTFAQQDSQRLQVGLNLSGPFGKARPQAQQQSNNPMGAIFRAANQGGQQGGQGAQQGQPGAGGTGFDPEQLAAIRERLCVAPQPGQEQEQAVPDLTGLPEQMLSRLRGEEGQIDPARLAQFRERVCSQDAAQGQRGQQEQGGFVRGPGGGGGPRGGGGGFRGPGGGGGDGRGRWFLNLGYTHEFENEVLVAPGGPLLDLLDGDALSGSQPRHSANFRGGLFYAGFGANVNARYTGSSRIDGSGLPGSTDLFFDDIVTVDVRMFADLNQRTSLVERVPLLKGTRLTFAVNNLFDARQTVTDSTGAVPLRYQPFLIDPVGRFFEIELRKLF